MLATLPFGWSAVGELRSGYARNVLSRVSRKQYFCAKYIAAFCSAVVVLLIPLLINLLVLSLFLPGLTPDNLYPYGIVGERSMWANLYYANPLLYTGLFIGLDAVFAGLIASLCVAGAFYLKHRITVLLFPFFSLLFLEYADTYLLPGWEISPVKFLRVLPVANDRLWGLILFEALFLFFISAGITWYRGKKYEAL